jgi:lipoate---protein ligase
MNTASHGECKTPEGKLAVAEVTTCDNVIQSARIHGDFFIHPEGREVEVMAGLTAALDGAPADLDLAALAARLSAAVPFGVELLGTSPEAIALAVRRAIHGPDDSSLVTERIGTFSPGEIESWTNRWKNMPWRLLPEVPLSPAMNVALDEVLTDAVAAGHSPPTLRFWRWDAPAVIIGRCQSVINEVDVAAAATKNVQIVRRLTGGGAMFLQPHGAITYSLYLPELMLQGLSIRQSYEVCEAWVIAGLRGLGVDAHHVPINDIACAAGKIGGAAQARRKGVVLHHTTMAYDMDPGEMVAVLRIGREKLKDKAVASASKRVSPLVQQTQMCRELIVEHLYKCFKARFGGTADALTAAELAAAEELMAAKYCNSEWTQAFA